MNIVQCRCKCLSCQFVLLVHSALNEFIEKWLQQQQRQQQRQRSCQLFYSSNFSGFNKTNSNDNNNSIVDIIISSAKYDVMTANLCWSWHMCESVLCDFTSNVANYVRLFATLTITRKQKTLIVYTMSTILTNDRKKLWPCQMPTKQNEIYSKWDTLCQCYSIKMMMYVQQIVLEVLKRAIFLIRNFFPSFH